MSSLHSLELRNRHLESASRCWQSGLLLLLTSALLHADDWRMFGRDATRNAVSPEKNPPRRWAADASQDWSRLVDTANVKWSQPLEEGTGSAVPVIVNGHVWVGATEAKELNSGGREWVPVLLCFRESDGQLIWRYQCPIDPAVRKNTFNLGLRRSPLIEGNRLWLTTPTAEVICLDLTPLYQGTGEPRELWRFDMVSELGVFVHPAVMMWSGPDSVALWDQWIYVVTDNGVDWAHAQLPSPDAPSLVCFEKETGKVAWADDSPGTNIFHVQWSSPLATELDGRGVVIAGLGDGVLRSFDARTGSLNWAVDCNLPSYRAGKYPQAQGPSEFVASPVIHEGRIYIAIGQDPMHGEGVGNLVCIDARSGQLIWQTQEVRRSMSSVVVTGGMVYASDFSGFVYGIEQQTGAVRWRFDARAHIWSSPLIVDDTLYQVDEDGDAMVFDLVSIAQHTALQAETQEWSERNPPPAIWQMNIGLPLYSSPVFANGTLYLNVSTHLAAITELGELPLPDATKRTALLPDALFVPTPHDVIARMLRMAEVKSSDRVVDLGSGDGRIVEAASAAFGANAVGYEVDPRLVERSRRTIREKQLEDRARIEHRDLFDADLAEMDVVTLFLPPELMDRLLPNLQKLKPGSRIVSHHFRFTDIPSQKSEVVESSVDGMPHEIHLWFAPLRKESSLKGVGSVKGSH